MLRISGWMLIAAVGVMIMSHDVGAQADSSHRVWPEPGNGEARHVIAARQGGFITVGHRTESDGRSTTFLTSVGRNGQSRWNQRLEGNGADIAFVVRELPKGGYIIGGWTSDSAHGTDVLLIRTDAEGRQQWRRTLESTASERITDLAITTDGGFVLAGQTSTERDSLDAVVIRTDSAGALKWRTVIGGSGNDRGFYISNLGDNDFLMSGLTTTPPSRDADMLIARVDRGGQVVWRRAVGGSGYQTAHGMLREADGGQLLIGYGVTDSTGDNNGIAYRVSPDGATSTPMRWGGSGDDRVLTGEIAHGDLFVTGYTRSFGSDEWALYVARIGRDGTTKWLSLFDRPGSQAGNAIAVDKDKVLAVGYEDVGDSTNMRDVFTVLTDIDGAGLRPAVTNQRSAISTSSGK